MNYTLLINEKQLDDFLQILPKEGPDEQYYVCLFSRKKYDKSGLLTHDKACLKRVTAKKEWIKHKIRQMQIEVGGYTYNDKPIPQHAMAMYMTPSPRDLWKASGEMLSELAKRIVRGEKGLNPQSLAMDKIQICSTNRPFFDVDVDFKPGADRSRAISHFCLSIQSILNDDEYRLILTRGGIHCLVLTKNIRKEITTKWHHAVAELRCDLYDIMMNSDGLIPIPGCYQGGFVPILIK